MATETAQITANASRVISTITIPIDGVNIIGLNVKDATAASLPLSVAVEIGIMSGGNSQTNRYLTLQRGYIGGLVGLGWTGAITGDAQQFAYLNIWADSADLILFSLTSKLKDS